MAFGPELCWPPVNLLADFKYSIGLLFKTKRKLLNMDDFEKIRELEKKAYPDDQHAYKNIDSIKGLKRIFACFNTRQIDYYLDEDSYCLVVLHYNLIYVADIVSLKDPQKTLKVMFDIIRKYKDKPFYMYAREKTAYKLMKAMEKKRTLVILEDQVEEDDEDDEAGVADEKQREIYHMLKVVAV